ncbi:hypothetical protein CVT25_000788 [Psilocybe cyanescens]|uniref:Uncharacterized protein n=1 Tax=Psilocybe cyanescens TaxID=93625 RepID=A0A409XY97_PSICY|nr:hypothetical protein CVT25_000788 [Psilocybe cyanescens]
MSTPDIPIPVNVQENEISGNLNSSMLLNFLMGIYTMVYGGTMYIYLSKKPANSNRCIILSAVSVMYFLCLLDFIIQWYYIDWTIVTNGNTRESIFWVTVEDSLEWISILNDFLQNFVFIISDGLLIWRCYHVWGQSFWAILTPLILLVAEFVIIESAAAYSMVLLLEAIIGIVPSFTVFGSPTSQADYYIEKQGMAPTVLVARTATNNNSVESSTLTHISGDLEFGSQQGSGSGRSGNTTGGDVNALVQADDAELTPVVELTRESIVDATSGDNQV